MKKAIISNKTWTGIDSLDDREKESYDRFIKSVADYADSFCMSVYTGVDMMDIEDFKKSCWGELKDSIIDYEITRESPCVEGTEVMLVYFKFDDAAMDYLLKKKHIYDFWDEDKVRTTENQNNWLWDIALIKDGEVFFTSCTYEEYCEITEDALVQIEK